MNFDISLQPCPTCGGPGNAWSWKTEDLLPTLEMTLGIDLSVFDGMTAGDILPVFEQGLSDMRARPSDPVRARAVSMLDEILKVCRENPAATVKVT